MRGLTGGAKNECRAMWNNADAIIRARRAPNEPLLWSARPRGGLAFRNEDFFLIPFSLLWGGFAIFWEWMATTSGAGTFAENWGIPFVAIALYMIVGRFFYDAWLRSNTYYGVTTQRAVIVRRTLRTITLGNDDSGSAWFALSPWGRSYYASAPRFEWIARASDVYDQIRDAQRAAQAP